MKRDMDGWLWDAAGQAADSGIARMCRDPYTAVYLYGKQGSVTTREDGNDPLDMGYSLVCAERLPRDYTREQLARWIHDRLRRFPCLPVEVTR